MNQPTNRDDTLARLIREAADQTQPRPALDAIRARTSSSPKESAMSVARTWILGGLGGAVATAAVIGGVYFATTSGDGDSQEPGPVDTPSVSESVDPTPSESPSGSPTISETPKPTTKVAAAVYYVGDAPGGLALYREFQRLEASSNDDGRQAGDPIRMSSAVDAALSGDPGDPDYRTLWPAGTSANAQFRKDTPDVLTIDLTGEVHDRPAGMTQRQAELSVEQLVYTAQAASGKGRVPVQFLLGGERTNTVLGVPTSEPLANGPILETLSHMNLTTPAEGDVVDGDALEISGVANSFEANVTVRLQRYEGTHVVLQDFITAEGCCEPKLFPFAKSFDISGVPAGKYVLTASTDDPSGGAEGNGPHVDTKVITIK